DEAVRAGRNITRIALALEAGRDGFWLARLLEARGSEFFYSIKKEGTPASRLKTAHRMVPQSHQVGSGGSPRATKSTPPSSSHAQARCRSVNGPTHLSTAANEGLQHASERHERRGPQAVYEHLPERPCGRDKRAAL